MILHWPFFLIVQSLILISYFLLKNSKDDFVLSKLFPSRCHFLVINICGFAAVFYYNSSTQLFCNPVPWATTLILLFSVAFLAFPFLVKSSKPIVPLLFFCGLGTFIAIYLLLFARYEYLLFATFNLPFIIGLCYLLRYVKRKFKTNIFDTFYFYPAFISTPFLLIYQLWVFSKSLQTQQKRIFFASPILAFVILFSLTTRVNSIVHKISVSENIENDLAEIVDNKLDWYLTELILGAHWKYHTQLCLYDGWRPPYHDPVLVVANKILHPFSQFNQGVDLPEAKVLYKTTFPNNKTEFTCRCAKTQFSF